MKNRNRIVVLAIILLIGTVLRFYHLTDFMQFGGDQGRDAFAARDIATFTNIKLIGPPSTTHGDLDSGPAYYYFLAVFSKVFNYVPEAGGVMVAAFGVLSILAFYFLAKEFFDKKWSLALTALYASSSLIVFYQRFPWNPNLLLFFVLIYFWSFIQFLIGKNRLRNALVMGGAFGLAIQMHFTAVILIFVTFTVLSIVEKKNLLSRKYLLLTFYFSLLTLLFHLPYLVYQYQHRFPVIKSVGKIILLFTGKSQATEGIAKISYLTQVDQNLNALTSFTSKLLFGFSSPALGGLILILILGGLLKLIAQLRTVLRRVVFLALAVWVVVSILIYAFYPNHLDEHYFLQFAPAVILGLGILMKEIGGVSRGREIITIGVVWMLVAVNTAVVWQQFNQLANGKYLPRYGITLAENRKVADFILKNKPPEPFSVQMFGKSRALSPVGYHYLLSLHDLKPNLDFLDSYRKVDYVFYVVEPKFVLEDPKEVVRLNAEIGHIHQKLAQVEIGNVKVVYAKRPHEIFAPN